LTSALLAFAVLLFAQPAEPTSRLARVADGDIIDSVYTDIVGKRCTTVATDEEVGSATARCRGVDGYDLLVHDEDARMSITVVAPDGSEHPLDYWQLITFDFSTLGTKAEWRLALRGGEVIPIALIVRVNASEADDPSVTTSYLAVAKITPEKICVTDRIGPSADMNAAARRAANTAERRPCLPYPEE
jgi:hypothetical protein